MWHTDGRTDSRPIRLRAVCRAEKYKLSVNVVFVLETNSLSFYVGPRRRRSWQLIKLCSATRVQVSVPPILHFFIIEIGTLIFYIVLYCIIVSWTSHPIAFTTFHVFLSSTSNRQTSSSIHVHSKHWVTVSFISCLAPLMYRFMLCCNL